jgi:hypothetical protein
VSPLEVGNLAAAAGIFVLCLVAAAAFWPGGRR